MSLPGIAQLLSMQKQGGPQAVVQKGAQALMNPQQAPGGISPQLLDLLAAQKALQMQKAAKDQMLAQMQPQPTVKDQVEGNLKQEAAKDIAERMAPAAQASGQQQTPQQAAQPPQPPSQGIAGMAKGGSVRGGIDNLPSKLKLAGGGIVAFEGGGDVTDENLPLTVKPEIVEFLKNLPSWLMHHEAPKSAADRAAEARENYGNEGRRKSLGEAPAVEAVAPKSDPERAPEKKVPAPTGSGKTGIAALVNSSKPSPDDDWQEYVRGKIKEGLNQDPDAAYKKMYEMSMNSPERQAILAEQKGLADERRAMNDAAMASRPTAFGSDKLYDLLTGIAAHKPTLAKGDALAAGAAGAKNIGDQQVAWAEKKLAGDKEVQALKAKWLEARASGNDAAEKAARDAYDRTVTAKSNALTNATNESTRMEAARARLEQARMHAETLAANRGAANKAEIQAATARMVALMQQTQLELNALTKEGLTLSPADEAHRQQLQQDLAVLKRQVAATIPGMDKVFTSPAAPAIDLSKWGQPKVKP